MVSTGVVHIMALVIVACLRNTEIKTKIGKTPHRAPGVSNVSDSEQAHRQVNLTVIDWSLSSPTGPRLLASSNPHSGHLRSKVSRAVKAGPSQTTDGICQVPSWHQQALPSPMRLRLYHVALSQTHINLQDARDRGVQLLGVTGTGGMKSVILAFGGGESRLSPGNEWARGRVS